MRKKRKKHMEPIAACWKGYHTPAGKPLKKKGGRFVPNCVKGKESHDDPKIKRWYYNDIAILHPDDYSSHTFARASNDVALTTLQSKNPHG